MSHNIIIRTGEDRDADALVSFNIAMAYETEQTELQLQTVSSGVKSLLNCPGHGFYIVAEVDGEVVGSLMVTNEWSDWRNGFFWWIQSVYVDPKYRRRGIYKRLYDHIKSMAAEQGNICGFRLYVERDNTVAQNTYASLGMKETYYKMYEETL